MLDLHRQHGFDPKPGQAHEKIPLTLADSGLGSDFNLFYSLRASMVLALTSFILLSFLALDTREEKLRSPNVRGVGQRKGTCLF